VPRRAHDAAQRYLPGIPPRSLAAALDAADVHIREDERKRQRAEVAEALSAQRAAYEDLLAGLWPCLQWRFVTGRLTTGQRTLFADAVDAHRERANAAGPGPGLHPVDRWWAD
jgi:hypothetical protein